MQLDKAVAGAVATATAQNLPTSVAGIAAMFGPDGKGIAGLAEALAGTSDRKSPEYKSALRNVERYSHKPGEINPRTGKEYEIRNPNKATREKLAGIADNKNRERTADAMRRDGVTISFSGAVIVSPRGRRPDERDRDIADVYLDPDHVAGFLDALAARDTTAAADEFNAAFMDAYGVSGAIISDVYALDFTIGGE